MKRFWFESSGRKCCLVLGGATILFPSHPCPVMILFLSVGVLTKWVKIHDK